MKSKNVLLVLLLTISSFMFAQKKKIPADFKLEYKYNAGMVQLREDLQLTKDKGTYKAFEKGKDFSVIFVKKNNAEIQKLYEKLYTSGFFNLKQEEASDVKVIEEVKDKASKTVSVFVEGKNYFLDEDYIVGMEAEQAKIVRAAFVIIEEFTKKRRK